MHWRAPTLAIATGFALVLSALTIGSPVSISAGATEPKVMSISAVQGTGSATEFGGQTVTVEGVVTADLRGAESYGGLYIQSQEPGTGASSGIFVALGMSNPGVSIGDLVSVTGTAGESDGETRITAATTRLVTASVGVPAATPLPDSVVGTAREAFEGMLVEPTGTYTLTSLKQLGTTGSLLVRSTGTDAAADTLTIDDGYSIPVDDARHPGGQPYLLADTITQVGDTLVAPDVPMVLSQAAAGYRLEPTIPVSSLTSARYNPEFSFSGFRLGDAPIAEPPTAG